MKFVNNPLLRVLIFFISEIMRMNVTGFRTTLRQLRFIKNPHDLPLFFSRPQSSIVKSKISSNIDNNYSIKLSSDETLLSGKHKWLGGAKDPTDGSIYGIPSHAKEIICLKPIKDNQNDCSNGYEIRKIPLPPMIKNGKFKWLRGIVHDGFLYGIPAWAKCGILKVDIDAIWGRRYQENDRNRHDLRQVQAKDSKEDSIGENEVVSILPIPELDSIEVDDDKNQSREGMNPTRWLWHGAAMDVNRTSIFCIPSNSHHVLKVDIKTSASFLVTIPESSTPLTLTNKWYGGILGKDDAIYGIPYAASGVLRIDANNDNVDIIGDFGVKQYNWHGGVLANNGAIYAFPSHNSHVLKIDTLPGITNDKRLSLLPIHRASYDIDNTTRYKWLGGNIGADGNVYGIPSDASSVLKIDTETDVVTTFGTVSSEKNKWQGGVLAKNGFLYALPSNSRQVLCINTAKNKEMNDNMIELFGNLSKTKDKFQGGFIGNDDAIYCIPENADRVMKIKFQEKNLLIEFLS